jgi:hypothetical protein
VEAFVSESTPYRSPMPPTEIVLRRPLGNLVLFTVMTSSFFILAIFCGWNGIWIGAAVNAGGGLLVGVQAASTARTILRLTPVAVRVTPTAVEVDYRGGMTHRIAAGDLRVDSRDGGIGLCDAGRRHHVAVADFRTQTDLPALVHALSELVGYDVFDPASEVLRLKAEAELGRAAVAASEEEAHAGVEVTTSPSGEESASG